MTLQLKTLCFEIEKALKDNVTVSDLEPELLELIDEMGNIVKASQQHQMK